MKPRDFFYTLGLRPKARTYGFKIDTFHLPKEGEIEYAQWLHPRVTPQKISQESIDELRKFLCPGDVAIDIGAHGGDTAVPMALAVGKSGCVLAFEPNSYVYPVLVQNAGLNITKTHIMPLPYAATPEDADLVFQYSDPGYCNGGQFDQVSRWIHGHAFELRVEGRNLLKLLQSGHGDIIPKIRYVKTDTEGNDEGVIQSIAELLFRYKPFLRFEMYGGLAKRQRLSLFRLVADLGYEMHRLVSERNYLGEQVVERDLSRLSHFDAFCVPK